MPGNTDPKKNTPRLLKAYSLYLKKSNHKRSLLIADLSEGDIDKILESEDIKEIKSFLRFPGYISNVDLPAIYSGAYLFLYPSLRESFGIPQLEAMACGTPVITGNTSAMPEICGNNALIVDPCNTEDISNSILRLEEDEVLYNHLVSLGRKHSKLSYWENDAKF